MEHPRRRRSDGVAPADGAGFVGRPLSDELWVRRCMIRMRQLDPQLALEDAEEIAVEMYEFERTGVMEPEAAVDFVVAQMREEPSFAVAQMRKEPLARLERRVANPRAAQADES